MKKIFSIYDSKAEAYLPPFFLNATGLALRYFEDAANNPEHDMSKYSADYTLFELGEFDENTCAFQFHNAMINLGLALNFKVRPEAGSLVSSEARDRHANGGEQEQTQPTPIHPIS